MNLLRESVKQFINGFDYGYSYDFDYGNVCVYDNDCVYGFDFDYTYGNRKGPHQQSLICKM